MTLCGKESALDVAPDVLLKAMQKEEKEEKERTRGDEGEEVVLVPNELLPDCGPGITRYQISTRDD